MSPSSEIGLLAPPIMTVIIFVLTWNIERASSQDGKISPRRLNFYGLASIPLMLFLYTIIWHVEIGNTWVANPYLGSLALVGIACFVIYLIAIPLRELASAKTWPIENESSRNTVLRSERSIARRIFAWIVIVWGLVGLVGGIVAIIRYSSLK